MNNKLPLRPTPSLRSIRLRHGLAAAGRFAWRLVLAAAPLGNLYWIVGMPPYDWKEPS